MTQYVVHIEPSPPPINKSNSINLTRHGKWLSEVVFGWHVLKTLIAEVEEEVAGRTGKTHNALIDLSDAVTNGSRWVHLVTTTTSFETRFFSKYLHYIAQSGRCTNLWLKMFPPCFFSLKMLTTCSTGKELRGTSFKIDGWVARGVIEPTHKIF